MGNIGSDIAANFRESIQKLEAEKSIIDRTLRGLAVICLAERIRNEHPEAKYMAIDTTFSGAKPFESISLENENGTTAPTEQLSPEIRYSIFNIEGDSLYPISTMIPNEPNTIYIEIDLLVGKLSPTNPAAALSKEYAREQTLNSLLTNATGLWASHINTDPNLNVLSWCGNSCHDDTINADDHPETAATLSEFMKSAKNHTRTSGRWQRNDRQGWTYRIR